MVYDLVEREKFFNIWVTNTRLRKLDFWKQLVQNAHRIYSFILGRHYIDMIMFNTTLTPYHFCQLTGERTTLSPFHLYHVIKLCSFLPTRLDRFSTHIDITNAKSSLHRRNHRICRIIHLHNHHCHNAQWSHLWMPSSYAALLTHASHDQWQK